MRNMTLTQTDTLTWAGDTTIAGDIERQGLITRVDIGVEIVPSATFTAANEIDGLFRLLQNFRIVGGSHVYMTLPTDDACLGGTLLHYRSQLDGFGYGHRDGGIVAPQSLYTPIIYPVHFGSHPFKDGRENPFDLSAVIPAQHESQLRMEWTTSGNDVVDATSTVGTTSVLRLTIHSVRGTPQELRAEMMNQGVILPPGTTGMMPAWTGVVDSPTATTTDFDARTVALPTGGWLKRILVGVQDATATRSIRASDELTRWSINTNKNERLYQAMFDLNLTKRLLGSNLTADSGALESAGTLKFGADFNAHAPQGIGEIDLRVRPLEAMDRLANALNKEYGWDMRKVSRGDLSIGEFLGTNASGDDMMYLFERYQAMTRPL